MTTTAFERVQTARHPDRPYSMDIFLDIFKGFVEIHGDRRYADDPAMVTGFATISEYEVMVIGQQKGRDINERRHRNFAMSKPEGYRKALRAMRMAEKFGRPIVTFIDTPGAYPGIDAEERGQAEAIAFNLREMAALKVPIITVIIGEGGSGGALAIGIGDRVIMMENAVYSVITPEGCAAILWKSAERAPDAAAGLKLTAGELKNFHIIDEIVPEPVSWTIGDDLKNGKRGDAFNKIAMSLKASILSSLDSLSTKEISILLEERYNKFRQMGRWV